MSPRSGNNEEVLQIQSGLTKESGKSGEVECKANRFGTVARNDTFARRPVGEQCAMEHGFVTRQHMLKFFIHGELADKIEDGADVGFSRGEDGDIGHGQKLFFHSRMAANTSAGAGLAPMSR